MGREIIVRINPILKPLIPQYLDNRETDLREIKQALSNCDYDAIRITGHNMRGSGAGYGFLPVTELGGNIEDAASIQDDHAIQNAINELSEYLNNVVPVYE